MLYYFGTDGENYRELSDRAWSFFKEKSQKHRDCNILIISHGGIVKEMLKSILSIPSEKKWIIARTIFGKCFCKLTFAGPKTFFNLHMHVNIR